VRRLTPLGAEVRPHLWRTDHQAGSLPRSRLSGTAGDGIITWEVVYGRFHSSFGCWEKVVEIHISSSREFLGQVISDIILHNTNTKFCLYCLWFMCVCAYIFHAHMCAFVDVHMCGLLGGKCGEMH